MRGVAACTATATIGAAAHRAIATVVAGGGAIGVVAKGTAPMATGIACTTAEVFAPVRTSHASAVIICKGPDTIVRDTPVGMWEGIAHAATIAGAPEAISPAGVIGLILLPVSRPLIAVQGIVPVRGTIEAGDTVPLPDVALAGPAVSGVPVLVPSVVVFVIRAPVIAAARIVREAFVLSVPSVAAVIIIVTASVVIAVTASVVLIAVIILVPPVMVVPAVLPVAHPAFVFVAIVVIAVSIVSFHSVPFIFYFISSF